MKFQVFFEKEEKKILHETEELHRVLTDLRYEGKAFRRKNLRRARAVATRMEHSQKRHRDLEEEILFPFLEINIPKYEGQIHFLRADHKEIKSNVSRLKKMLLQLGEKTGRNDPINTSKIHENGFYLICLLRHHAQLEKQGVHAAMATDLNGDEKKQIQKRIKIWSDGHDGRRRVPP